MRLSRIKAGRLFMFPLFLMIFAYVWIYDYFYWDRIARQEQYRLTQGIAYAYRNGAWREFMENCVTWLYGLNPDDNIDGEVNE